MLPTTLAGPYTLNLYIDNPSVVLKATQSGTAGEAPFVYHWLGAYKGGARLGSELVAGLEVRVLGNPMSGWEVRVEVRGAEGSDVSLSIRL